jgi:hypothetical protein
MSFFSFEFLWLCCVFLIVPFLHISGVLQEQSGHFENSPLSSILKVGIVCCESARISRERQ